MTDSPLPVLSVRGDARQTVAPDAVGLPGSITAVRESKAAALADVAGSLARLTDGLRSLGGLALTVDTERHSLTWSAYSASTHPERAPDPQTGAFALTGLVNATLAISLAVRDFDLLDRLGNMLATHEELTIHHAGWSVDADNPAWPQVRAAAIHSAIQKGRDYATALGGSLADVVHIADAGLLGGDASAVFHHSAARGAGFDASMGPGQEGPSLDPVPQELVATIEARFTASGISL